MPTKDVNICDKTLSVHEGWMINRDDAPRKEQLQFWKLEKLLECHCRLIARRPIRRTHTIWMCYRLGHQDTYHRMINCFLRRQRIVRKNKTFDASKAKPITGAYVQLEFPKDSTRFNFISFLFCDHSFASIFSCGGRAASQVQAPFFSCRFCNSITTTNKMQRKSINHRVLICSLRIIYDISVTVVVVVVYDERVRAPWAQLG